MPTYMGNIGHLMQHWTLCEIVQIAGEKGEPGLSFIDAHSMAPWATRRRRQDATFDRVQDERLAADSETAYEWAWYQLLQEHGEEEGYPNSAALVEKVWEGEFSLLLCEIYPPTVEVIERWLERCERPQRRRTAEVFEGDWRKRFRQGTPCPWAVGLETESLTLISFDPYKYDSRPEAQAEPNGDLYPEDIELLVSKLSQLESGVIIQLSTYALPRGSTLEDVRDSVDTLLENGDFARCCEPVRIPRRNMMSLVYSRNVPWADDLENLSDDFARWFAAI